MDTEWFELKDWAIQILSDYKEELLYQKKVTGKTPSALKKVDRFYNALALDTEKTYADMLANARSKGLTPEALARKGRNMEENIMNAFRVLPDDPAHHMYSLRTAGDLIQKVPSTIREEGLKMLKDMGYDLGNVRRNLISLAEYVHQGRTGKGAELAALGDIVVDKSKVAVAHPRGTGDPLISKTVNWRNIKSPQDFVNAYLPLLKQQTQDVQGALATSAPREQMLSQAVEQGTGIQDIFSTARTAQEVKTGRQFLQTVPDIVRQSYLTFKGGKVMLGLASLVPGAAALKGVSAVLDAQSVKAAVTQAQEPMSTRESLATALEGVSGAAGLASLTPAAPVAGPISVGTGVAAAAVRAKAEQKIPKVLKKVEEVKQQVFPLESMINQLGIKFVNGAVQFGSMIGRYKRP